MTAPSSHLSSGLIKGQRSRLSHRRPLIPGRPRPVSRLFRRTQRAVWEPERGWCSWALLCLLCVIILSSSRSSPAPASVIKIFIYLIWKLLLMLIPNDSLEMEEGSRKVKEEGRGDRMEAHEGRQRGRRGRMTWNINIWSQPMWHWSLHDNKISRSGVFYWLGWDAQVIRSGKYENMNFFISIGPSYWDSGKWRSGFFLCSNVPALLSGSISPRTRPPLSGNKTFIPF